MSIKITLFIGCFLLVSILHPYQHVSAQNNTYDSLLQRVESYPVSDTNKARLHLDFARHYAIKDNVYLSHLNKALDISIKENAWLIATHSKILKSSYFFAQQDFEIAIQTAQEALALSKKAEISYLLQAYQQVQALPPSYLKGEVCEIIGSGYGNSKKMDTAEIWILKALAIYTEIANSMGQISAYAGLISCDMILHQGQNASKYRSAVIERLPLIDTTNYKTYRKAYTALSFAALANRQYKLGLQDLQKLLDIYKKQQNLP